MYGEVSKTEIRRTERMRVTYLVLSHHGEFYTYHKVPQSIAQTSQTIHTSVKI